MPYLQVTRAELRSQLQTRFDGVPFWSTDDANDAINETLRWWNAFTGVWRTTQTIVAPPASEDHLVALNGYLIGRTRIRVDGQARPLIPISIFNLARIRPNWMYEYTDTLGLPTTIQWFAPVGLYVIRVWPGNRANATLIVDGMAATPILTSDTQYVQLGEEDLDALLDEALHISAFKHGGDLFLSTIPLHQNFLRTAAERNSRLLVSRAFKMYAGLDRQRFSAPVANPSVLPAFAEIAGPTTPPSS